MEPSYAPASFPLLFSAARSYWVEAEACLPDGRRIFAVTNITATASTRSLNDALDTTPHFFAFRGLVWQPTRVTTVTMPPKAAV